MNTDDMKQFLTLASTVSEVNKTVRGLNTVIEGMAGLLERLIGQVEIAQRKIIALEVKAGLNTP